MAEINTTSYLAIAADYASGAAGLVGLSQHYYDAAYEVLILSVFDPELDLLQPFYNAYLAASGTYTNVPISAISAVGELQRHILRRATDADGDPYTSINAYYAANAGVFTAAIPEEFADISALAGFTITDTYIAP